MNLREDWNRFYKFISVQALIASAALPEAWSMIPQDWKNSIPQNWIMFASKALLIVAFIGIMIKQNNLQDK